MTDSYPLMILSIRENWKRAFARFGYVHSKNHRHRHRQTSILTRLQLKRQHSSEPFTGSGAESTGTPTSGTTPPATERSTTPPKATPSSAAPEQPVPTINGPDGFLGSPLKKQRASVSTADENALRRRIAESSGRISEVLGSGADNDSKAVGAGSFGDKLGSNAPNLGKDEEEEEL